MSARRICWLGLFSLLLLGGCSSTDSRLFEAGDPPRLRNGTIRLMTYWVPGKERWKDIRVARAREGKVSVSHITQEGEHYVGEAPAEAWEKLWVRLLDARVFGRKGLDVQDPDQKGGPYHVIHLQLGEQVGRFSSQFKQNLLVFSSRDVSLRLALSNAIIRFVSDHATQKLEDIIKEKAPPPGSPPKKRAEDREKQP